MMPTAQEMVDKIDEAICAVIDGCHQSYSIAGRSVTRLSLDELRRMRNYWQIKANRENKNGRIVVKGARPCR